MYFHPPHYKKYTFIYFQKDRFRVLSCQNTCGLWWGGKACCVQSPSCTVFLSFSGSFLTMGGLVYIFMATQRTHSSHIQHSLGHPWVLSFSHGSTVRLEMSSRSREEASKAWVEHQQILLQGSPPIPTPPIPYPAPEKVSHQQLLPWNYLRQTTGYLRPSSWICQGVLSPAFLRVSWEWFAFHCPVY